LLKYPALLPPDFAQRITESSLKYLAVAPIGMKMPDIESLVELVRLLPTGENTEALSKLKNVLSAAVVKDPKQWNNYNVKPLTFVHSSTRRFTTVRTK
jgi:hypothetical protein